MPTSVLLAVLAAAGLLALAPALVRRYDATERIEADRARSTARVLNRDRRRRTVPVSARPRYGPRTDASTSDGSGEVGRSVWLPLQAETRVEEPTLDGAAADPGMRGPERITERLGRNRDEVPVRVAAADRASGPDRAARPAAPGRRAARPPVVRTTVPATAPSLDRAAPARRSQRRRRVPQNPAVYRRRRVLALLVVLNLVELIGVLAVSPGFWTGLSVTLLLLVGYVVHLRNQALMDRRTRRVQARRAARIALEQAEIRAAHEQRIAARRDALRRDAAARAEAQREAKRLSQSYVDFDPRRGARVRGRRYEQGPDRAVG